MLSHGCMSRKLSSRSMTWQPSYLLDLHNVCRASPYPDLYKPGSSPNSTTPRHIQRLIKRCFLWASKHPGAPVLEALPVSAVNRGISCPCPYLPLSPLILLSSNSPLAPYLECHISWPLIPNCPGLSLPSIVMIQASSHICPSSGRMSEHQLYNLGIEQASAHPTT